MTRDFCPRCAIKHLAQARALMKETKLGYPLHVYYAIGHMAEASDELVEFMPDEAAEVRAERLKLEEFLRSGVTYTVNFDKLFISVANGAMLEETLRDGTQVSESDNNPA